MRNRNGMAGIFRVIAGGYLIYLGIKVMRDGVLTGSMQGTSRIVGILASVAFVVFGAWFIVHAIRWMSKNREEEEAEAEENAGQVEEIPVEEQAPAAPSLFDRAGFGALQDDEEEEPDEDMDTDE